MNEMSSPAGTGIGHNSGQSALEHMLDPEVLGEQLALLHAKQLTRRDELLAGVARFGAAHPAGVTDDAIAARLTSFVKQLKDTIKDIEADRTRAKRPFDAAAKAVDGFFNVGIRDKLQPEVRRLEGMLGTYQRAKAAEEQRRRDEEARRRREEAERVAAAARATEHPDVIETAIKASEQADRAERAAAKPIADMGRARGAVGGTSQLRTVYEFEVEDLARVPLQYLQINESAVKSAIRLAKGEISIPGIRVIIDTKAVVA